MAFLTPFPNTLGFSVVIPKEHHDSYIFNVDQRVMHEIMDAAKLVADRITENLEDVGRCGVIFEGFGVNHLHAKIFPMHGTADMKQWEQKKSDIDTYFETYSGYISSHDSKPADPAELARTAKTIRGES